MLASDSDGERDGEQHVAKRRPGREAGEAGEEGGEWSRFLVQMREQGDEADEEEEDEDRDYLYRGDDGAVDEWEDELGEVSDEEVQQLLGDTGATRSSARARGRRPPSAGAAGAAGGAGVAGGGGAAGGAAGEAAEPGLRFSDEQVRRLQIQLHVHTQLLAQVMRRGHTASSAGSSRTISGRSRLISESR